MDVTLLIPLLLCLAGSLAAVAWRARLNRVSSRVASWVLALLPALAFILLLSLVPAKAAPPETLAFLWMPSLGLSVSFYLDGLAGLFALLVTGIGVLVVIYAGYYLAGDPSAPRFYAYLFLFMAAMLGLVLAGDLLTLWFCWECTSIASFLLIGYKQKDPKARAAALKSLFITGGAGIALLAGVVWIGSLTGGVDYQTVLSSGALLRISQWYAPVFALFPFAAFTKSAQFPAHIWLPEAMSAPTPASAYLHSATMVKAGIYLLARMNPAIGQIDAWFWTLSLVGLLTMLLGAYQGFRQNDLKALLAYSKINQLGAMVMLIGQDTEIAFKALVIMKWSNFDRWLKADHLQGKARSLTIDQVVVEDVYSQAEKRLRPAPVVYFKETKKGLVLSGTNQDALQAVFGDDVTACFGKRVLLEPTPMRVAGRERLTAVRVWSSGSKPRRRATGPARRRRRLKTRRLMHQWPPTEPSRTWRRWHPVEDAKGERCRPASLPLLFL